MFDYSFLNSQEEQDQFYEMVSDYRYLQEALDEGSEGLFDELIGSAVALLGKFDQEVNAKNVINVALYFTDFLGVM